MGFHQEADPIQGPNSSPVRSGFQVISLAEKAGNSLVKMKSKILEIENLDRIA